MFIFEVKWIKITTNMFDDEKIKLIESMPDKDSLLVIWIKLLVQAGRCNASGYIVLSEKIPYTDEMLATIFNRPLNTIRLALETFEELGMIKTDEENRIFISNWDKHQSVDKLNKMKEQNRLRQEKHRKKQQLLEEGEEGNVTITLSNGTDIDIDLDKELDTDKEKNKKREGNTSASDSEKNILKIFKSIPNYPYNYADDLEHLREVSVDYPSVDVLEETKKWKTYKRDKPLKKNSNARLQFRNWIKNASEWEEKSDRKVADF